MVSELFNKTTSIAKETYPNLEVKYKNENLFMLLLGKVLFFNKDFLTEYITTIDDMMFFPNEKTINNRPVTSVVLFIHELTHLYDYKKSGKFLYSFLYLFPFSLILFVPILFFIKWYLGLLLLGLCFAPLPAYFRKKIEMRGYITSLYAIHCLSKKQGFTVNYDKLIDGFTDQFCNSAYYFMWPFRASVKKELTNALHTILLDKNPLDEETLEVAKKIIENL